MEENKIIYNGEGERIDIYLKRIYSSFSREFIKKLINSGSIKVNLRQVKPSFILKDGDEIEIKIDFPQTGLNFSISSIKIYEDDDIIVLNKPAGVLVHPTDDNWLKDPLALELSKDTIAWLLFKEGYGSSDKNLTRLGIVHRLDAMTSGVMIVTKNSKAQNNITRQFNERIVNKNYKAVVQGIIEDDFLVIDAPIGRFSGAKKISVMEYGRDALTEIKKIKCGKKNSYLDVFPKTGRTNQIRVHLSYIKHPIVGDNIYSNSDYDRLMLHSYKISFIHPSRNKRVEFTVPPDKDFNQRLKKLLE
ncbi:MAG: RluA family pseudouridine synthase [Elusimicrobiota bacterium]